MTDRQRAFLDAYFADPRRNATRAAAEAGYAWPDKQGSRLKQFPGVAEAIRAEEERQAREWRERSKELARAAADRFWRSLPEWFRMGLPRPKGTRGRYRRRQCM
jgi:phage terminase small subunit